ncbi:hypothetical protein CHU32_03690 [Superficieibacter electus]|uniref:Uncharacterized protein n=1 Tax=Superficieibacter electus TaxID=2022662 RepID=A0A2P5GVF2_9ENTR|nr:hypothetical protein [Superficieibacter electus]POP50536.1 hypothetical protein CHU32_03690 [Superficieibacter electus]
MTPQKKRTRRAALEQAAAAPTKRWLGKAVLLTGVQSAWIKSLLTVWGECVRDDTAPKKTRTHTCWHANRCMRWSNTALEKLTAALDQARREGFHGQQALKRAHAILWPAPARNLIDEAIADDDAEFIEQCVLATFDSNDPVYVIGVSYYTTRKKISDLTRDIQHIAPWLTPDEARRRVRWCVEIFRAKVYLTVYKSMEEE